MVNGLEKFKAAFAEYSDQYVLIGGTACELVMEDFESSFRATKDLDIVLIVEALTPQFGKAFWKFIEDGKYRNKSISTKNPHFYRFDKPAEAGFPYMLELFSRSSFPLEVPKGNLVSLHFEDDVSSLSAILLNDAYYEMLMVGRILKDGISFLSASYLIPFNAKAWLDLTEKKKSGFHVDEKDIRKHKNDIVRLTTVLSGKDVVQLPEEVHNDMQKFLSDLDQSSIDLKGIKIRGISVREIIEILKRVYVRSDDQSASERQ